MPNKLLFTTLVILLAAHMAGTSVAHAESSVSTPPQTGCPAAYERLSVEELEEIDEDYLVPGRLDDMANGGNGNGWVCGLAMPEAFAAQQCGTPCRVPVVYLFREDDSPANQ